MRYAIHHANILDWAAAYTGPRYHALLCDPPYHLTEITKRFGSAESAPAQYGTDGAFQRASKGFMGKQWDGGRIAFEPETWAALAQHLHPGAYGMAFASTRGYHRMACAIEDAGLIIHTMLGWSFGCLSDDTEILTRRGWQPYHKAIAGTDVLCYNMASGSLAWHAVQELYTYAYNDTAYHIHSDHTDQIVSRNHRCIVERGGTYVFRFAETLQRQEIITILESMPAVRSAVQRGKRNRVRSQATLQQGMRFGGNQQSQAGSPEETASRSQGQNNYLPWLRSAGLEAGCLAAQKQGGILFPRMPRQGGNGAATQKARGEWQGQTPTRQGFVRPEEPSLEGRSYLLQKAWELYRGQVCSLPASVHEHGSEGQLCHGTPLVRCPGDRTALAAVGSGTSQGPQSGKQRPEQFATVQQQPRSQVVRTPWGARPDLATVTPVHYRGIVWCVRVPTGAFVARRNGKVFITGNSGFPKATRLDVQIDRRAGAEPKVIGTRQHAPKFNAKAQGYREKDNGFNSRDRLTFDVTEPATELAAAWAGHRYGGQAIKPAFEPIVLFQKPYQGQPVDSITRTGAGALNIEAGRIGVSEADRESVRGSTRGAIKGMDYVYGLGTVANGEPVEYNPAGRWPANLLLSHNPDCGDQCTPGCAVAALGDQSGPRAAGGRVTGAEPSDPTGGIYDTGWRRAPSPGRRPGGFGDIGAGTGDPRSNAPEYADEGTAARFFFNADWMLDRIDNPVRYVAKASTTEREAGLDGWEPTTVDDGRQTPIDNPYLRGGTQRKNTHPTVKPINLAEYLATLLLPPALYAPRRILIPFSGSGSEMIGVGLAGWEECDGIELEAEHIEIARARLAWWIDVF